MSNTESTWQTGLVERAATDVGMRRSNNQDSHKVVLANSLERWQQRGHFFMVADGMGAHAAGELASKLAVDNVPHLYVKHADLSPPEALEKAIVETNAEIHNRGQANADFHQMGTTASCLALLPQGALVAHVGDSRVYRLRRDKLHQLTFDHSLVWEMRRNNQIKEGEEHSIPKNVITRSLGPNDHVRVDIEGPLAVEQGDKFLLCSDGLTGPVEDEELGAVMSALPPDTAAQMLIDVANLRGGPDNTTVIIVEVTSPEVATGASDSAPLAIGKRDGQPIPPAAWVAPAVCLLVALVLLLADQKVLALGLAVAGVAALLYALFKTVGGVKGITLSDQRRLGKGPYVELPCPGGDEAISRLGGIVDELRERARLCRWELNWQEIDQHCEAAAQSRDPNRYAMAVRCMMTELRALMARQASDSAVEL